MIQVLGLLCYGLVSLFGIVVSVCFADIKWNKKNILCICCFFLLALVLQKMCIRDRAFSVYGMKSGPSVCFSSDDASTLPSSILPVINIFSASCHNLFTSQSDGLSDGSFLSALYRHFFRFYVFSHIYFQICLFSIALLTVKYLSLIHI